MLELRHQIKIGKKVIEIKEDVKDAREMFKKLAFYSQLPEVGPTGNQNLEIQFRTPKNFEYINIVDTEAKKQFSFGTAKETGELFCKGWGPLYEGNPEPQDKEKIPVVKQQNKSSMNEVLTKYGLGK